MLVRPCVITVLFPTRGWLLYVASHKVCYAVSKGDLRFRSIKAINKEAMFRLYWELDSSSSQWAIILRAQVLRGNSLVICYTRSSIWIGLNPLLSTMQGTILGKLEMAKKIHFWSYKWSSKLLIELLHLPALMKKDLQSFRFHSCRWL